MSKLVSVKCKNIREDMPSDGDRLAALFVEQISSMDINETLDFSVVVASIDASERFLTTAAITTIADKDMAWELMTNRLMKDAKHNYLSLTQYERAYYALRRCGICKHLIILSKNDF